MSAENDITGEVTKALGEIRAGDSGAVEKLFPLVYRELRALADRHLRGERADHTLQPTALVHETYLRLLGPTTLEFNDRRHFLAVCAQAMRRILVDYARAHRSQKRGGTRERVPLDDVTAELDEPSIDLEALDRALEKLAEDDPRRAQVVELRYFGGLKDHEIAEVLEIGVRTVRRDWKYARTWLCHEIDQEGANGT